MKYFNSLLALCLVLLAACPKPASASPPHNTLSLLVSDSAKVTLAQPCNGNAATVKCHANWSATFDGNAITLPAIADVNIGQSWPVLVIPVTCSPLKVVAVSVTLYGVNASGDQSSGTVLSGSATCSDSPPGNPVNTLTVIIKVGGG